MLKLNLIDNLSVTFTCPNKRLKQ